MERSTPLKRRLAIYVAAVGALLALNNSLPYVGLRDDSCQTMFSGLEWTARTNNHWFVPQYALGDGWEYLRGVRATVTPPPSSERTEYLVRWLSQSDRELNLDAVRVAARQLCREGHRVELSYVRDRERRSTADACGGSLARPSWWVPIRRFDSDVPGPSE